MAEDQEERTEEATQTRRDEFRKKGEVAFSRELGTTLIMAVAAMAVFALSRFLFRELYETFRMNFGTDMVLAARSGDLFTALRFAGEKLLIIIGPVVLAVGFIGVGAQLIQTGFLQVEDALTPNFNKINPIEGLQRMFSLKNLVEGFKAFLKLLIIFSVVFLVIKSEIIRVPDLVQYTVTQTFSYLGSVTVKLFSAMAMALSILTAADYFFQRWNLEKRMRMTKQEIKEENKSREGDPLIKARIRRVQREVANRRMMQKVPKADVIITNPTHIAVALRYGADVPAPILLAKGADRIAEKIKEIAKEHNIPIIENKPLARTIFKTMKLGQVVPRELFVAVAEVLSYVYKLKKKARF